MTDERGPGSRPEEQGDPASADDTQPVGAWHEERTEPLERTEQLEPHEPLASGQPLERPGHDPAWDPFAPGPADGGYPGSAPEWDQRGWDAAPWQAGDWTRDHHATTQAGLAAPGRRGPGWGALVAVALVSALVAGGLAGLVGGWLGSTGRLELGRPASIPTVGPGATSRPAGSIAAIAAKALPSVVTIQVKGADGSGTGSGFVLDRAGHIVTNNHVVAEAATGGRIRVVLSNGDELEATIAGRDASYDLAVLRTTRTDLPPLTMGSSASVVVGDPVIAVGAPLGLDSTVTSGIVSALNRPVSPGGDGDVQSFINAIQTDAAINPGNSGGPLLDMQGHVIGVNSAIARVPGSASSQSGNIGVGFSIPSDQVVKTAAQLIRTGSASHPVIGVVLDNGFTGEGAKVLAKQAAGGQAPVTKGGPAEKAGIKPGDVIVAFDGKKITGSDDLVVAIRARSVGDTVSLTVLRGGRQITVSLTLQGSTND